MYSVEKNFTISKVIKVCDMCHTERCKHICDNNNKNYVSDVYLMKLSVNLTYYYKLTIDRWSIHEYIGSWSWSNVNYYKECERGEWTFFLIAWIYEWTWCLEIGCLEQKNMKGVTSNMGTNKKPFFLVCYLSFTLVII